MEGGRKEGKKREGKGEEEQDETGGEKRVHMEGNGGKRRTKRKSRKGVNQEWKRKAMNTTEWDKTDRKS